MKGPSIKIEWFDVVVTWTGVTRPHVVAVMVTAGTAAEKVHQVADHGFWLTSTKFIPPSQVVSIELISQGWR